MQLVYRSIHSFNPFFCHSVINGFTNWTHKKYTLFVLLFFRFSTGLISYQLMLYHFHKYVFAMRPQTFTIHTLYTKSLAESKVLRCLAETHQQPFHYKLLLSFQSVQCSFKSWVASTSQRKKGRAQEKEKE